MALSEAVPATCPSQGFGGPSPALCDGAAPGEVRLGYWDVQAGEGLIVTEAELRATLERRLLALSGAAGSDVYGTGELRVGALSCARAPGAPQGSCDQGWLRVHLTYISPASLDASQGTGIPGERTSFHVSLHRDSTGELKLDGIGTIVPPNSVLQPMQIEAYADDGELVTLQFYPWTP
jgi:hypothetical protein